MKQSFFRAAFRIGLSGAGAQIIVFLSLPILTRLYNAESFGVWAVIQSSALLIGSFATCRYELAVVLPKRHEDAASVLIVGVIIAFLVASVLTGILPFLAPLLLGSVSNFSMIYWAIPLLVLLSAANQLALSWSIRTSSFSLYSIAQLSLALMCAAFPMLLAGQSVGASGLVIGTLLATGIVSIGLWCWIGYFLYLKKIWKHFSLKKMRLAAYKYRNYPLYMTPYTFVSTMRERVVYFLLANYAGTSEVGLYSMAQRLTNAPNSLAASALRPVFFQHIAQEKPDQISYIISKVMLWITILVVPPVIFFFFFPQSIVSLLLGDGWVDSAEYVMVLSIAMLPLILGNWMDRYFDVLSRQRLAFSMELIFSVTATSALAIVFFLGFNAKIAVIFQAVVMSLYYTIWIWVLFRIAMIPMVIFFRTVGLVVFTIIINVTIIWFLTCYFSFLVSCVGFCCIWLGGLLVVWKTNCLDSLIIHD